MVQGASLRLELMYVYSFGNQIMMEKKVVFHLSSWPHV